jgi:hypothetical protein
VISTAASRTTAGTCVAVQIVHPVRLDQHRGAERLERGMGEEGRTVFRLDHGGAVQRRLDIAVVAQAAVAELVRARVAQRLPHLGAAGG